MVCRVLFDFLLKLLNLVLGIVGLGMIGYGIYLLVEWIKFSDSNSNSISHLLLLSLSNDITDELSKAWFIYAFIGLGIILFLMSCFGCIGASTRNGCCLSFVIPVDKTGDFEMIYNFLRKNWKIAKWVALGAVVFEAFAFMLALAVQSMNQPSDDSDDEEYMIGQQSQRANRMSPAQQPLVNNNNQVPTLEPRPIRNDAWSQRMKDKYGIDVLNFSYTNQANNPNEERKRCVIL